MNLITILLIAIGLSMDSFAVSISNGLVIKNLDLKKSIIIASSLAFFQGLMPLLGWFIGASIDEFVSDYDHWVAFAILGFIGSKMIYDGLSKKGETEKSELKFTTLIMQSIATSIDALAVGLSFALIDIDIIFPLIVIGITTFVFSIVGLQLGKLLGSKLGGKVEIFGGLVLLGIAFKMLIESYV